MKKKEDINGNVFIEASYKIFALSRNPDGYFRHPASRAYFQSRISPILLQDPDTGLQIRQIPHPENPTGDRLLG